MISPILRPKAEIVRKQKKKRSDPWIYQESPLNSRLMRGQPSCQNLSLKREAGRAKTSVWFYSSRQGAGGGGDRRQQDGEGVEVSSPFKRLSYGGALSRWTSSVCLFQWGMRVWACLNSLELSSSSLTFRRSAFAELYDGSALWTAKASSACAPTFPSWHTLAAPLWLNLCRKNLLVIQVRASCVHPQRQKRPSAFRWITRQRLWQKVRRAQPEKGFDFS